MVIYESADKYLETASSLEEQIELIQDIINALYTSALKAAGKEGITEYSLDDGQTKIKAIYRDSASVVKSIEAYRHLKKSMLADLNTRSTGRMIRMVDSKNFKYDG